MISNTLFHSSPADLLNRYCYLFYEEYSSSGFTEEETGAQSGPVQAIFKVKYSISFGTAYWEVWGYGISSNQKVVPE